MFCLVVWDPRTSVLIIGSALVSCFGFVTFLMVFLSS